MITKTFIATTAGHVDHGKTSLIKALTGKNTDTLKDEKTRGLSIDIGFANKNYCIDKNNLAFQLGFIDVPGHENFIKNMLSGIISVDLALLVVAANEGPKQQTYEHLQILDYLETRKLIVILTKSDLSSNYSRVINAITTSIQNTRFKGAPIIPVSLVKKNGISLLEKTIIETLGQLPSRPANGKTRLAIDRSFNVAGAGKVVTGTLTGNKLHHGEKVQLYPSNTVTRIREIQNFNSSISQAYPSMRIAINLSDSRTNKAEKKLPLKGSFLALPNSLEETNYIDALIFCFPGNISNLKKSVIRNNSLVRLHHGTTNFVANIKIESSFKLEGLPKGSQCFSRLFIKVSRPFLVGDKFIIRDWSQTSTLAGGIVLDPAPRLSFTSNIQRRLLENTNKNLTNLESVCETRISALQVLPLKNLLNILPADRIFVIRIIEKLSARKIVIMANDVLFYYEWVNKSYTVICNSIQSFILQNSQRLGTPITYVRDQSRTLLMRFKRGLENQKNIKALNDIIKTKLLNSGYTIKENLIFPNNYKPSVNEQIKVSVDNIRKKLLSYGSSPPTRKTFCISENDRTAIEFLINSGEVTSIGNETILITSIYNSIKQQIFSYLKRNKTATTSELRLSAGTNRRVMIALLEKLDEEKITKRHNDKRSLISQHTPLP